MTNQAYEEQTPREQWLPVILGAANWSPEETAALGSANTRPQLLTEYERQMSRFHVEEEEGFTRLRKEYVLDEYHDVEAFLRNNRSLVEILLDAVPHLKACFGSESVLHLRLGGDMEDGPNVVCGVVSWNKSLDSGRNALDAFDESWWLDNSRKASGRVVFDYELT